MKFKSMTLTILFTLSVSCLAMEQKTQVTYKDLAIEIKAYIAEFIIGSASSQKELLTEYAHYAQVDKEHNDISQSFKPVVKRKLKEFQFLNRLALMKRAQNLIDVTYVAHNNILLTNNPDALDINGLTAVTNLVTNWSYRTHPGLIEMLLELGASPHVTYQNRSLLMHTLLNQDSLDGKNLIPIKETIVKILVNYGADINASATINGVNNVTPLDYALERALLKPEYYSIVNFLKDHGAIANHIHRHNLATIFARTMSAVLGSEAAKLWTEND